MQHQTIQPVPDEKQTVKPTTPRAVTWLLWLVLLPAAGVSVVWAARAILARWGDATAEPRPRAAVLPVTTIFPKRHTLVRKLEQPGSILPNAQAELYAKTSGYLRALRRELTAELVATMVANPRGLLGVPALAVALWQAPPIDIGTKVQTGDLLLAIDVPERQQDIVERGAVVHQREEELELTKTSVGTVQAAVEVAQAHLKQAEADMKRYKSEHAFRLKELARVKDLVRDRAVEPRLQDEKQAQVEAALAAWESSQAKHTSAKADLTLARSKLATARADVRVKEALLEVAKADLERARIVLAYSHLEAPFSGIVTYRGVDEGDFVQNSRTGQSRHLMTITSIDKVKIGLKVPSREGVLVRVGADAVITVDSRPGEKFVGQVSRTRRVLDSQSRTLEVEIDLDNRHGKLMPGMYGHVTLSLTTLTDAWTVPAAALFSRNKINYLILAQQGVARRQPVRILFDDGDRVGVVKLIQKGEVPLDGTEEIIISSKGEIADGQRVQSPNSLAEESARERPGGDYVSK